MTSRVVGASDPEHSPRIPAHAASFPAEIIETDMKIRPATIADAPALMDVRLAVRENVITPERLEELGISETSIIRMLTTTHSGYCAEEEGRVVGFVMAESSAASIWALFVRPESEGRGIGMRLLSAVLEQLWLAGHEKATLSTETDTRAYQFYTRYGWQQVGVNPLGEAQMELRRPTRISTAS